MTLQQRINAFVQLGKFLSQFTQNEMVQKDDVLNNDLFFDGMKHQMKLASEDNGWFTRQNILFAIEGWAEQLTEEKLKAWMDTYAFAKTPETTNPVSSIEQSTFSQTVAVVMAGNIPLVGFHDFLSVLIIGKSFVGKQSSNDKHLLPFLAKYLEYAEPEFKGHIAFTEDKLPEHDAVIATGSDNTARYFEYYFGKKPHIIRKNRNSVALLTGNETSEDLNALGEDVFRYYGLGCRNVSKLLVPKDYNFDAFFNAMYGWKDIIEQAKYANNYDYNKTVYLMSLFEMLENGFLMLKEDKSYGSPIATLFYEYYNSQDALSEKLKQDIDKLQCVVGSEEVLEHFRKSEDKILATKLVPFGMTQKPALHDYADGVDTIAFLLTI